MKSVGYTLLFIVLAAVMLQCKNSKRVSEAPAVSEGVDTVKVVASIYRSPCYGRCPVYKATIYANSEVKYVGEMNVEKMGTYKSKLSAEQLEALKNKVEEIDYFNLEDKYDGNITDIPVCITYVSIGDHSKEIYNRYEGPVSLSEYEKLFDKILEELDWEMVSKPAQEVQEERD